MSGLPVPFTCPGCGAVLGESTAEVLIIYGDGRHTSTYTGIHHCRRRRSTRLRWHPTRTPPRRRFADGVAVMEALPCPSR